MVCGLHLPWAGSMVKTCAVRSRSLQKLSHPTGWMKKFNSGSARELGLRLDSLRLASMMRAAV